MLPAVIYSIDKLLAYIFFLERCEDKIERERLQAIISLMGHYFIKSKILECNYINDAISRDILKKVLYSDFSRAKNERQIVDFKIICDETNNAPDFIENGSIALTIYVISYYSKNFYINWRNLTDAEIQIFYNCIKGN